ncbi:MAG TPA: GNVR domain-containing protein [Clostridiales bacterium]|nr:GNVR domain-containing protein [Clostridiales bacterium]
MEKNNITKDNLKNEESIQNSDSIDFFYFIRIIFKYKYFIGIFTFIIAVASIAYVLLAMPIYEASATMYPVQKGQSGPLRELANTFGLANKIEGFNIPEVIKSKTIARLIISKKYKTVAFKDSVNLIQYWQIDKTFTNAEFAMERAIRTLGQNMNVKDDKETYLISIIVRMPERQLAADVANYIATAVTDNLQDEQKKTTAQSREYLETRLNDAEKRLLDIEQEMIEFKEKNYQQNSPSLRAEIIRLERKFTLMQNFVAMLHKQRELILLDEVREKPVVNILDKATITNKPIKPKKREVVVTNTFAAFILSVTLVLLKEKFYTAELIDKIKKSIKGL